MQLVVIARYLTNRGLSLFFYIIESENKNFTYLNQLVLGQTRHSTFFKYSNLKDVSQININNFDIHNKGKFIYSAGVIDKEIHKVRSSLMTIYDVNVDYLYRMGYNNVIKKFGKDSLEYYLLIFTCENKEQVNKIFKGDGKVVKKIREAVNSWDNDDFWITREDILSSYRNGDSKDLILKSTGITEKNLMIF